MDSYQQNMQEETAYLEKTVEFIRSALEAAAETASDKKRGLIASRRDMWENTAHHSRDFTKLTEINQYLSEVNIKEADYQRTMKRIDIYRKILGSPYFGRVDFIEEGSDRREKIYIGLYNAMDDRTHDILVYDWRAPVASMFYQYELGSASYDAPVGAISGEMLLKRQYRIQDSKLNYFFDCSIRINDEILQEVLSRNSSPEMRNIVETIQKEQDLIIRDTENDLLIVQGVAGSGKTSIALHRIAFLLYNGMSTNLNSNNFLIISPNTVFSRYISSVLPELGEENVEQMTFDEIVDKHFIGRLIAEPRNVHIEDLILSQNHGEEMAVKRSSIELKGSRVFVQILDRLIRHCERNTIPFEDVYFNGRIIETKQRLKNTFINDQTGSPMAKRLKRIENIILNKVHPLRKTRREKIEKVVEKSVGHELEVRAFSRLLSIREARRFIDRLRRFTVVDYVHLYQALFNEPGLLCKLAQGLELPEDIEQIVIKTKKSLDKGYVDHEDCAPLLYLKLRVEGSGQFSDIRQVIIDEAQDYYPLQYEVFKLLFKNAGYTVLGDVHQAVEKNADISLYNEIEGILNKNKRAKLVFNKSYRSSYEINEFTQGLLGKEQQYTPFKRHEAEPIVIYKKNRELIDQAIAQDVDNYFGEGYESIAVICKTKKEAEMTWASLKSLKNAKLVASNDGTVEKGVSVIPAYMAKGLEFDVVLVHDASQDNYSTEFDRRLLYIACTRALHRLALYHTGEKSRLLSN